MMSRAICLLSLLGCGARPQHRPAVTVSDEVTLYRDRALVSQRVEVVAAAAGPLRVTVKVAAGVGPDDLVILDRGELLISALRARGSVDDEPAHTVAREAKDPADAANGSADGPAPSAPPTAPVEVELVVRAPRMGRFTLSLGYATERIAWDAAYTMTTTAARDHAVLHGTVAIRNTSGIALRAHAYVVDGALGAWRDRGAARPATMRVGPPPAEPVRDLGRVALGEGETQVELVAETAPHKMRSVLVYDPIGTGLDHPGSAPVSDPAIGVAVAAPTRITESLEIDRDDRTTTGLPAGPVRLVERRPDGALVVLGTSRLGGAATRVASVDTIAIGIADAVVGHRERRDWGRDEDQKRFSEEFLLTIDNARPRPVDVVIREHLYRGQNWTLAYQSAPAVKEGPQQIALRTTVPANGQSKVLYVVVYTW